MYVAVYKYLLICLSEGTDYRGYCEAAQIGLHCLPSFPQWHPMNKGHGQLEFHEYHQKLFVPLPLILLSCVLYHQVFVDLLFQNKLTDSWLSYLSILRFRLVCEQFWLLVFPPGELCVNWVPAVMTWVNYIECQRFLNEHMVQPVIYMKGFICRAFHKKFQQIWIMNENKGVVFIVLGNGPVFW